MTLHLTLYLFQGIRHIGTFLKALDISVPTCAIVKDVS